ncbi:MAG: N-acetylglucosamine/diacetylchitobiose ABC transporter substrate-binding protein [Chloroflexota bacterium]|nr:N-acetylglucosamine/diacetylchitobiose ABC transporter substrate-binding protein [Chloroflexota bacterium]
MSKLTHRTLLALVAISLIVVLLAGCAVPAAPPAAPVEKAAPVEEAVEEPSEEPHVNPLGLEPEASTEGVFFEGGLGRAYLDNAAEIFARVHPDNPMSVEGIQQVSERLRPRFIEGNPPDVIDNSGAFALPRAPLVDEDQMADLAPLMNAPSLDTPGKTFGETLMPGSQDSGVWDGTQRELNITMTVFGIWYSQTLFNEMGWEYPTTWDGMLDFCEAREAEDYNCWTYQGKFPQYMVFGVLTPLIYKNGGLQAIIDIDNLEDGAWETDAVRKSVEQMAELAKREFIMPGTEGLTHTESQAEWLQGNAIFIPNGSWLENEMRDLTPEGFDMVVAPVPGTTEDTSHSLLANAGEPYFVPSAATNVEGGMEFMRVLMSKENAKFFANNVGVIMPIIGGTEGVELSSALESALGALDGAGDDIFADKFYLGGWYTDLKNEVKDRTGDLLTNRITVDEFIEAMQSKADEIKADPDVTKYTRES